ncbi:hypothetical protein DMN91_005129 [Ooceraea biroi]|uniref:Mos1 transposase HTH domain-containing protein n=1 Tax=Ooceraea biroi TaxID=2015173 RepID=A0A3L8DR30_OOCBI|nr:hypothetical protein DMN91_005129 [Ooceraea biroi]
MEKSKIRGIYEYVFRRGTTVSETARNINAVFGEGSTTKATVGDWFKNFRDGDFSLANEPRGRPKTKVDNDHLRAVVESDPSQSTRELASIFNVSIPTILVHLAAIVSLSNRAELDVRDQERGESSRGVPVEVTVGVVDSSTRRRLIDRSR